MLLSITDVMKTTWDKSNGAKGTIWACMGIILLVQVLTQILVGLVDATGIRFLALVVAVIGMIIAFLLMGGLIYVAIRRVKGEAIDYGMMKHVFTWRFFINLVLFHLIVNVILGSVFFGIMMIFGPSNFVVFILFVLFLFVLVRVSFGIALIVDKNMDVLTALKHSISITSGNTFRLVGLWLLMMVVVSISVIPLGLGLIWTLPWAQLCYAEAYKRLGLDSGSSV
jgi:hypothetical protein